MAKKRNYELSIVKNEELMGNVDVVLAHRIVLHIEGDVSSFDVAYPIESIGNGGEIETIEEMIEYLVSRVIVFGFKCIRDEEKLKRQFQEIHNAMTEEQVQAVRKIFEKDGQ